MTHDLALDHRNSGVLLHITSLPGPHGIGDLGPACRHFIDWLDTAAGLEPKAFPSVGLGQDLRLESDQIVGAALVVDDAPVHVQLFALGA